jgi:hypothetical protein
VAFSTATPCGVPTTILLGLCWAVSSQERRRTTPITASAAAMIAIQSARVHAAVKRPA